MMYRTAGIIVRIALRGDYDQIFTVVTPQYGRIQLVGRGTKRGGSKLNQQMQFFAVLDMAAVHGRNIDQLVGVTMRQRFSGIYQDFNKIILASLASEIADQLLPPHQADQAGFSALKNCLHLIEAMPIQSRDDWQVVQRKIITDLLTSAGYEPPMSAQNSGLGLFNFLDQQLRWPLRSLRYKAALFV